MSENLSPQQKSWVTRRLKALGVGVSKEVPVPPPAAPKEPVKQSTVDEKQQLRGKYDYIREKDMYVTFFKGDITPTLIDGETHRKMCKDYSNWTGPEATVQTICDRYNFPKAKFSEYKEMHGWSHDHPPFTKEEILEKPKEILVEELIKSKTTDLRAKAAMKEARDNKTYAEKWLYFSDSIKEAIDGLLADREVYNICLLDIIEADRPYAAVIAPFDLHFGKAGWVDETGQSYSRLECTDLLKFHTEDLISRVIKNGRPERIIWVAGSDYLHIDNPAGKTTAGTAQDTDGTYGIILKEGFELAVEHIDMLRQIAPVEVVLAAGNHDEASSIALLMFLHAWYRNTEDVQVNLSLTPRNYTSYGNTLIAVAHGDKTNPHTLSRIIPHEAKHLWSDFEHTALFTGHLHYELSRDDSGVMCYQVPSLSGSDRWHSKGGYVLSRRAMSAYLIDLEDGPIAQVFSPVRAKKALFGFRKSQWRKKR